MQSTQQSSQSFELSYSMSSKLEELIDVPIYKKMIDSFISLLTYLDNYAPKIPVLYQIITIIRATQLIGTALMASNINFWDMSTITGKVMGIISIPFHIVPTQYRIDNEWIILYVYDAIAYFFAIFCFSVSYIYKTTTRIDKTSTYIVSFWMSIGPYYTAPIGVQYIGQLISAWINGRQKIDVKSGVALVLGICAVLLWSLIMISIYSTTLNFRPTSFLAIEGKPQNLLFIDILLVTLFTSLTSYITSTPTIILMALAAIVYAFNCSTCFNCGTYVSEINQILCLGGSFFGVIILGVSLYSVIVNFRWSEYIFIVYIGCGIVCFIAAFYIIKFKARKNLAALDTFQDSNDIAAFHSPGRFKGCLTTGFTYCHPVCLNYSVFKAAVDEWPENLSIWGAYAKFAAIYSENNQTLLLIGQNVVKIKARSNMKDTILSNIASIIKMRETNLSPNLKSGISKVTKVTQKAKNRLRNIWDLVLQGKTAEMGNAISEAMDRVEETETELKHLVLVYPNNRFVARQYARFQHEIKADTEQYKIWNDNVQILQRGGQINPDTVHDLGLSAFPNIPDHIETNAVQSVISIEAEMTADEPGSDDEGNVDTTDVIALTINRHVIPAIRFIYISTAGLYFALIVIPIVAMMIGFPIYTEGLLTPVDMLHGIAYMRNLINMMPVFAAKYALENIPDPNNRSQSIISTTTIAADFPMDAFGGFRKSNEIIGFLISQVPLALEKLSTVLYFMPNDEYVTNAREAIYTNDLVYKFFLNETTYTAQDATATDMCTQISTQVQKVKDNTNFTQDYVKQSEFLTAINNNVAPTKRFNNALSDLTDFITHYNKRNQIICYSIMGTYIALVVICYFVVLMIQQHMYRKNKRDIYNLLTILPKTIISTISANYDSLKKNSVSQTSGAENHEETNPQEENIIKVLSSITDGTGTASFQLFGAACFVIIALCGCLASYFLMDSYQIASTSLVTSSPHVNYLMGACSFIYAILASLFKILMDGYPGMHGMMQNKTEEFEIITDMQKEEVEYLNQLRFGRPSEGKKPFIGMTDALARASTMLKCPSYTAPPHTLTESAVCFSAEWQIYLCLAFVKKLNQQILLNTSLNARNDKLNDIFQVGPVQLYQAFFFPTGDDIVETTKKEINQQNKTLITKGVIFILIALVFSIAIIIMTHHEDKLLKFCLRLFLKCPPKVVLSNQRIMDVLSGDYNTIEEGKGKVSNYSFEVVNKLNDPVVILKEQDNTITNINEAFEKMFGKSITDVQGMKFHDFIEEFHLQMQNSDDIFNKETAEATMAGPEGEKMYLGFSNLTSNGNKIITIRDKTQNVLHEQMIEEEKKKSDTMLASILPASLVPRVQAGEKNISFSVQSASVLFLDIVEFTPWCGSHEAQYVMKMLNMLFKEFDALTNERKTMTKIKCIGDCYVCAGGIFDEVNQPQVHAREVVDFGCHAIKKILDVNESQNESLRIRVGVNTGGPIVAGVLGTEKPTFEILGPTINIAEQMESKGVPMQVQISRPVYELIYGSQFVIKERGEVELKRGKMFCYLVEP